MGGKSSSTVVGYWYHPAFHMGISLGPIDALLEIRGGDKTAWSGNLTQSGTITVSASYLWGGEKDQGGIAGDFDVMFGEPTQMPNAYLTSTFGSQQPAWRGLTTIVFKGGRYGAMNPYPQKISYKGVKVTHGWHGDPGDGSACWYPEKALVPCAGSQSGQIFADDIAFPATDASIDGSFAGFVITGVQPTDVIIITKPSGLLYEAWSPWASDDNPAADGLPWTNRFEVTTQAGVHTTYWDVSYATAASAQAAAAKLSISLTGSSQYTIWLYDAPTDDNRGGLSLRVFKNGVLGMNPAHTLYYARTQQHMAREPAANIDDASHRAAADWFFSQGFGLCWEYDSSQESVDDFVARIEKVAGCSQTRSPVDGKWYLDVANGIYDIGSLPILTDDDILDFQRQPTTPNNAINSVSVKYFDPQKWSDVVTPPVQALALANAFGTIHQDIDHPEIPTATLALRIAARELLNNVMPTNGFALKTTRKTFDWRRGTYFRLQTVKRGIADMVCLLGDKDDGTLKSGAISITCAQDIYSLPSTSFVQQEPGVDTRPSPIALVIARQAAFEAPYFRLVRSMSRADLLALPDDAGFMMTTAQDPATSRDYTIAVSTDGGTTYTSEANGPWCPTALIVEGDMLQGHAPTTSFTTTGGTRLAQVQTGSAALWDGEIVRVDAIDVAVGTLTIGRGCADTLPLPHAANTRIWFFDMFAGSDTTEYTEGETIRVKLLTNTGSAQLDASAALVIPLTLDGRHARPYPPAGLKINAEWYPEVIVGDLSLAWVQRNRVMQADQLVDTMTAEVTPEVGQSTTVRVYDETDALIYTRAEITADAFTLPSATETGETFVADAYWADVTSLLHFDGTDGSTTITDEKGATWTARGAAKLTSAELLFGTASLDLDGSTGTDIVASSATGRSFAGDGTLDLAIYPRSNTGLQFIYGNRGAAGNNKFALCLSNNQISFLLWNNVGAYFQVGPTPAIQPNAFTRIAVSRAGNTFTVAIDGHIAASGLISGSFTPTAPVTIGSGTPGSGVNYLNACVDELRYTDGVGRYASDYPLPSGAFGATVPYAGRLNGRLRVEVESSRDGTVSWQHHDWTVRRAGYGMNYGMYYGGHA